ncbi:MAG: hypothetical protein IJK26_09315 [Clostridia bacterium]|nr:hypothetical protein [Clostridia bacterium]
MILTNNAKKRMKEKCNANKKSLERIAKNAFEKGYTHSQTKGSLNKWITRLWHINPAANNIRIYGDKAYIFCDNRLITVIQIPANLTKNMKSMIKEQNIEEI